MHYLRIFLLVLIIFSEGNSIYCQTSVFLRSGGNITTPGDWGTSADGLSGTLSDFTVDHIYNFSNNNSSRSLSTSWGITASSSVVLGDGTNGFTLTYSGSAALGSTANLVVNNNAVLDLARSYNLDNTKTTFNSGSTIIFNTGSGNLATDDFSKVRIEGNISGNSSTISATSDFIVTGAAVLTLDANSRLDLSGMMDVQGTLSASNSGHIFLTNSGSIDLNLSTGASLLTLDINRSGTYNIYNNLEVVSEFRLAGGLFRLNGHKLTLNGNITFGSGIIRGNSSSEIEIGGSGTITNGLNMDPTITEFTNLLRTLTLNRNGASLSLASDLYISGSVTPSSGTLITNSNLILVSNTFVKGRIGIITSTGDISGDVTVNVFKPAGVTNWVNLCSGGVTGKTMANWNSSFNITCPTCPDGSVVGNQTFTSVYSYSESAASGDANDPLHYIGIPNISTPIDSKMGYWVYLGNGFPSTSAITIPLTGTVHTKSSPGNIGLTVTGGSSSENGWNLIANPYPSPILVSAIETAGGASIDAASISAYDPDTDGLVTYSSAGSNSVIPMGQAFYVRAISAVNLTPSESWKVTTDNNTSLLKQNSGNTPLGKNGMPYFFNDFLIDLQSNSVAKNFFTQTYIRFEQGATAGYDQSKDAFSMKSPIDPGCPRIFSPVNGERLMRTVLPPLSGSLSIPLQVNTAYPGTYKLQPVSLDKLPYGTCVVLKDLLNNQSHDLKNGAYSVYIASGATAPQFELHFSLNNVPVASTQQIDPLCSNQPTGKLIAKGHGTGPWNYLWKDQNGGILRQQFNASGADTLQSLYPGNYQVQINSSGTCDHASNHFVLNALTPQPVASFQASQLNSSIFAWEPIHFTNLSQHASSYSWDFGNGVSAGTYHGSMAYALPGNYTVKLNAYNDCAELAESQLQVQITANPLAIEESTAFSEELFLQAEGDALYLCNYAASRDIQLEVFNVLGQQLLDKQQLNAVEGKVRINLQPSGNLLLIRLSDDRGSRTQRLVY